MSEKLIKCPNCNGFLIVKNNKKECPYCGAEFVIKQESQSVQQRNQNEDSGLSPVEKLFDYSNAQKSKANAKTWETLQVIFLNINKNLSSNAYFNYFKESATDSMRSLKDIAAFDINAALMSKVKTRLRALLYDDEELFYYRDTGIISRGKSGVLYTDSRIFFLTKQSTIFIDYESIRSFKSGKGINALMNDWVINNDACLRLDTLKTDDGGLGVEIAFICEVARSINEDNKNYKITIEFI